MPQAPSIAPPSPLPPASAEYETAMHAGPGKIPRVQKWKMFRSSQGETHLDFGKTALISKPGTKQLILLDHVKQEARFLPAPAHAQAPQPPSAPAPGGVAHPPEPPSELLHVKDLGKQTIGGHEADGKMYSFKPPKVPPVPGTKGLPGMQPPSPQPPPAGATHGQVQTLEVWTHTTLKVPVLTKVGGTQGLQSHVCKGTKAGEPPASLFQIPPGYRLVEPKPPALTRT